jgi:tRNA-intron endonuclease, archaea type
MVDNTSKATLIRALVGAYVLVKSTMVTAVFMKGMIITENSNEARELYNQSRYGILLKDNRVQLSLLETAFLYEKQKIVVVNGRNKEITMDDFLKKVRRLEQNFNTRFKVFSDLRSRGYVVKTALKFGADFRVYDRGVKPGEDHARWVVYPVREGETMTYHDFAAKNRVAHSTKKRLLMGVVDDEGDVSYWEVRWLRP